MFFKKFGFFFFIAISVFRTFSQEDFNIDSDSLLTKNYDELRNIFYYYKNSGKKQEAKKIAHYTLSRAKKENNTKAKANSYIRLCRIFNENPNLALKYIDSSINVSIRNNFSELLAEGYFFKARTYFSMEKYDSSLIFYVKAKNYYELSGNTKMFYTVYNNIGLIKQRVDEDEEALEIFKECYKYDKALGYENVRMIDHLATIASLSIAYAANSKADSTTLMNIEGYKLAKNTKNFDPLVFTHLEGGNQYFLGNYRIAQDSLLKAVPYLVESKSNADLSYAYFHLGKIALHFSDEDRAVYYYKKIDSVFLESKYILPEPREIYETLINYYKEQENIKEQLYYTERLLLIDSVLTRDYKKLISTLKKEFDTPELKKKKRELENSLNKKNRGIKFLVFLIFILSLLSIFSLIYFQKKKKRNEENFNKIIEGLKTKKGVEEKMKIIKKDVSLNISEEIVNSVLKKLVDFEKNEGFLEQKLNLTKLAKYLETNNKYLSSIINTYKSKTFNTYIHDLRIDYAINKLKKNKIFRKYTIKAIASEIGYTNTESFTIAFRKKTGISVSFYIKKINSAEK